MQNTSTLFKTPICNSQGKQSLDQRRLIFRAPLIAVLQVHLAVAALHAEVGTVPRPLDAAEQLQETFAKAHVHEAVGDGIAAAGRVGQQLQQADASVADGVVDILVGEEDDGVDGVERRPADEELQHHHAQHLDDALFVAEAALRVGAPQPAHQPLGAVGADGGVGLVRPVAEGGPVGLLSGDVRFILDSPTGRRVHLQVHVDLHG